MSKRIGGYILPKTIRGALASTCNQKDTHEITTINIDGT